MNKKNNHLLVFNIFLIVLVPILLAFGQLQNLRFWLTPQSVYLHELLILGSITVALTQPKFKQLISKNLLLSIKKWPFLVFLLSFSLIVNTIIDPKTATWGWLYLTRFVVLLTFIAGSLWTFRQVNKEFWLQASLIYANMLFVGWGFLQLVLIPDLRWLHTLGFDDHVFRLASTLLDPNWAGALLGIWSLWLLELQKKHSKWSFFYQILLFFNILALTLSFSRASWLAFAISLPFLFSFTKNWVRPKYIVMLLVFVILSALYAHFFSSEGTKIFRFNSILYRFEAISEYFSSLEWWQVLIGTGFLFPVRLEIPEYADLTARQITNSWLIPFSAGGVLMMGWLTTKWKFWFNKWRTSSNLTKSLVVFILIHGFFNATLVFPFLILLLGLIWVVEKLSR